MMRNAAFAILLIGLTAPAPAQTLYGFFPSPSLMTQKSVIDTYRGLGEHGEVVLFARNVPWKDFLAGPNGTSADIDELNGMVQLAQMNGLEPVFVVDPLNGLDRRQFFGLPAGWTASFADPRVRAAMMNYTLRIVREFHPRYLALASEINTYQDTHPDDFPSFMSLYREMYARVKAAAPDTAVFVTFQWEELNNLIPGVDGGKAAYDTRWEQMQAFEPQLDLWAISTYPFVKFPSAYGIPSTYYARLAARTAKPLIVAEGGYTSEEVAGLPGTPEDQIGFLNAIHDQIGSRLRLWIYTVLGDFSLDSYRPFLEQQGLGTQVSTLGMFAHIGLLTTDGVPKPGLVTWDSFRGK